MEEYVRVERENRGVKMEELVFIGEYGEVGYE